MRFLFNSFIICFLLISCERDIPIEIPIEPIPYNPTFVEFLSPIGFPPANIPIEHPMTEEGILLGKKLKISKERVRQIETKALEKLKRAILDISQQDKEFFI